MVFKPELLLTSVLQSCSHFGGHSQEGLIHLFGESLIHLLCGLIITGKRKMCLDSFNICNTTSKLPYGNRLPNFLRSYWNTPVVFTAYKEQSLPTLFVIEGRINFLHCFGQTKAGYWFRIATYKIIAAESPHLMTCEQTRSRLYSKSM